MICVILVGFSPRPVAPMQAGVGKERHYPYIFLQLMRGLQYNSSIGVATALQEAISYHFRF